MRSHAEVAAMSCPVCRVPLAMSERSGIEIDYCPQCRGVWLDRGELDKIIERSAPAAEPAFQSGAQSAPRPQSVSQPQPSAPLHTGGGQSPWDGGGYSHGGYGHGRPDSRGTGEYYSKGKPYKKRKSWLSELFDD